MLIIGGETWRSAGPETDEAGEQVGRYGAGDPPATEEQIAAAAIPTMRPKELAARTVTTAKGAFGHLRIRTFHIKKDPGAPPEAPRPSGRSSKR